MKKILLLSALFLLLITRTQSQAFFGLDSSPTADVILISSGTVSAQPSIIVTFSSYISIYKAIMVKFYNISGSANPDVSMQVSPDGTTWATGSTDYAYAYVTGGGVNKTSPSTGTGPVVVFPLGTGTSGYSCTGSVIINNPNSAGFYPNIGFDFGGQDYFNNWGQRQTGYITRVNKQQVQGIKLVPSGGTLSCDAYEIWGIK